MEYRIYRENIRVRHREADRNGRLKLLSWFDFLQEAAANHAARLGVGLNALTERGQLWVLSRLKLEIRRSPQIGEELTVETYPSGVNRLFFTREFQVFDKSGEVIARASSAWLLLSAAKLRPLRPDQLPCPLPDNSDLPVHFRLDEKLPGDDALAEEFAVPVRFSMEDVNGHLNNAEYAGLVQDYVMWKTGEGPCFRTVELAFLSAVRAPASLHIAGAVDGNRLFVQGRNDEGALSFTARALFQS